jgi:glycosyltransferase involved in cell wall biosynthesis
MVPGRAGLQQRILPAYRAAFFDLLARSCVGGLSIFAGEAASGEAIHPARSLENARVHKAKNIHFLRPGSPLYFCWQKGLTGWLSDWDPGVLIAEANPRYLSTPTALGWMKERNRPVIGWGLGAPAGSGWMEKVRAGRQASFLGRFDALIAYSAQGAEEFRALGYPADRIYVAPNAVSLRPESPPTRPARVLEGPASILFVGRLVERKKVDVLIRACSLLPLETRPRLVIVGDGPAREDLQRLAGLIFPQAEFTGPIHGRDLEPYYSTSDLFVLPGTGGLAVQEAMAHGLPVAVGRGDGTQGDLVRPENGWLIPDDSPATLAEVLLEALDDPLRLRKMGSESYRIVRDEINIEKMVEVFLEVIDHFSAPSSNP